MNKILIRKILVLLIIWIPVHMQAQEAGIPLAQQYDQVVTKAGSYKIYKNVRKTGIQGLWKNVTDSLQKERSLLQESRALNEKNSQDIALLQAEISSLKGSDSPMVKLGRVGSSLKGSGNNIILWGLLVLLAAALVFALLRTRAALKEAAYRSELYNELFEELRESRHKANDREKILARELQNERNRVEELQGKKK